MGSVCGCEGTVVLATTPWGRLRGIANAGRGDLLLLAPCRDVHTFGVAGDLDIAFIDGRGRVLASYRDVGPQRRLRCSAAAAVVERRSARDAAWFRQGDVVGMTRMKGLNESGSNVSEG